MYEDVKKQLETAIEQARNWPVKGWQVNFGPRRTEVASLKQALESPKTFAQRQEAIAYWRNVELISQDVTKSLEAALVALNKNDLKTVKNRVYAALYMEKPLEVYSNTSKSVYESVRSL